jgi:hypothetical protein
VKAELSFTEKAYSPVKLMKVLDPPPKWDSKVRFGGE